MDSAPLNYLTSFGGGANSILPLTWGLCAISFAVMAIVAGLVAEGIRRKRGGVTGAGILAADRPRPLQWVYAGLAASCVVLLGAAVWTLYVLAAIAGHDRAPALSIDVTGHQWWWEARYLDSDPFNVFATANELHIPVGARVRINLASADVIHSFWIPALAGKTDVVPGQRNVAWLEADRPGTYFGQCAEYCGTQHAHMGLRVVADTPETFQRWRSEQLEPVSSPPSGTAAAQGEVIFQSRCGGCHRVRGTLAGGALGPDLTHVATRKTIAAGTVPNTPAYLSAWIADPQHIKPGTQMPAMPLSGQDLQAIRSFLAGTG